MPEYTISAEFKIALGYYAREIASAVAGEASIMAEQLGLEYDGTPKGLLDETALVEVIMDFDQVQAASREEAREKVLAVVESIAGARDVFCFEVRKA